MKIEQIYTGCLAQGAYYIESAGEAVIIDPLRETSPYIEKLEKEGSTLKYIFETHFHADFVSGHLDLSQKTGAQIVYGPNAAPEFEIYQAKDNEILKIGDIEIKVLHTPGHTMESTTFLLRDENGKDHAIFTGDALFIGDVGRPDLAVKTDLTKEDLAGYLFDSLREKIMPLADDVIVYPAHGAGSACGKNLSTETWDTLGNQKKTNYALRHDMTRDEFIEEVLDGISTPPQYFPENVRMNQTGIKSVDQILSKGTKALTPEMFEQVVEFEDALVLDTRTRDEFAKEYIPNSVFIGIDGNFAPWVGSLIPDLKQPILIVADESRIDEIVTRLSRVGYDNSMGYLKGGLKAWKESGRETDKFEVISADDLAEVLKDKSKTTHVIDVRREGEFEAEHLECANNLPLDEINSNMAGYPKEGSCFVHCKSGFRSAIALSIMKARGYTNLIDVEGGFEAIEQTSLPVTEFVCQSTKSVKEAESE